MKDNIDVICGSGILQGTRDMETKPVDLGSVRLKAQSHFSEYRLDASRQNLAPLVFYCPQITVTSVYREGAEKFKDGDAGKQEAGIDIRRAAFYVLSCYGSGAQKDVNALSEGCCDFVSAGMEAKGSQVVKSHRNPANYKSHRWTLNDSWQTRRSHRITRSVNLQYSGTERTSDILRRADKLKTQKWVRGCFVHHFT